MLCVYQFKVVLRGISPMIWRRLLLRSDQSIADLHYTIQIAMDWSDSHLRRPDRIDRRAINQRLQQYARGERKWLFCDSIG
jgi:hypothetical protein